MLLLVLLLALLAPQGGAVITGTVVARDSNRPVQRARVTLRPVGAGPSMSTTTDAQGVFRFTGLSSGRYAISASKSGFLTSYYGEKTPGVSRAGTPIAITATQRLDGVVLRMPRGGAIAGVISDDLGDPAFGVQVRALQLRTGPDGRSVSIAGTATTDDRGVYRVPLLSPGDYVVCATPAAENIRQSSDTFFLRPSSAGIPLPPPSPITTTLDDRQLTSYVPVCFPGTTQFTGATPIALGLSEERAGVDVQLLLQPALSVSGTVVVEPGGGAFSTEVQLVASGSSAIPAVAGISTWNTTVSPTGQFQLAGIPPGQYTLFARAHRAPASALDAAGRRVLGVVSEVRWASEDLTVGAASVQDLVLNLQRGLSVSGKVVFDGPVPARPSRMVVMFTPAGNVRGLAELGGIQSAPVDDDGRFTMTDLVPGRYRLEPTPIPAPFTLESAVFNGRDVLDAPLEVKAGAPMPAGVLTLTTKHTEVEGRLFEIGGAPAIARTVVVFAEDQRYWTFGSRRILIATTNETGAFTFGNLPPGNYLIAPADLDGRSAFDPAVLKEITAVATAVTLAAGETKLVDVRIR